MFYGRSSPARRCQAVPASLPSPCPLPSWTGRSRFPPAVPAVPPLGAAPGAPRAAARHGEDAGGAGPPAQPGWGGGLPLCQSTRAPRSRGAPWSQEGGDTETGRSFLSGQGHSGLLSRARTAGACCSVQRRLLRSLRSSGTPRAGCAASCALMPMPRVTGDEVVEVFSNRRVAGSGSGPWRETRAPKVTEHCDELDDLVRQHDLERRELYQEAPGFGVAQGAVHQRLPAGVLSLGLGRGPHSRARGGRSGICAGCGVCTKHGEWGWLQCPSFSTSVLSIAEISPEGGDAAREMRSR